MRVDKAGEMRVDKAGGRRNTDLSWPGQQTVDSTWRQTVNSRLYAVDSIQQIRVDKAGGRSNTDPSWPGQSVASAKSGPQGGNWKVIRADLAVSLLLVSFLMS